MREDDVCLEDNILDTQKGACLVYSRKGKEKNEFKERNRKKWIREIMRGQVRCPRTMMRKQTTLRDNSEQQSEQK